jgi:hypothetical protein
MNRDDIIRMAREAECSETWGGDAFQFTVEEIEHFAALVAAAEREACKDLWEAQKLTDRQISDHIVAAVAAEREACTKVCDELELANLYGVKECAEAIRARGNT